MRPTESSSLSHVPTGNPVSDVSLKTKPPGGWVMEGNKLVLICSVANTTENITYLWYRGALGLNLEKKTLPSITAEFEISEVKQSDVDQYYCAADNGHGPVPSELVNINVRGKKHKIPHLSQQVSSKLHTPRSCPLGHSVRLSL